MMMMMISEEQLTTAELKNISHFKYRISLTTYKHKRVTQLIKNS